MLEFNHNLQVFDQAFNNTHTEDGVVPMIEARAYWDNQTVEIQLHGVQETELDWSQNWLRWELNGVGGVERIAPVKMGKSEAAMGSIRIPMARVQSAQLLSLKLTLIDQTNSEITHKKADLLVLPSQAAQARYTGKVVIQTWAGSEAAIVRQLNYDVDTRLSKYTDLLITNCPDAKALKWVWEGGKMLFISEDDQSVFWPRGHGNLADGNWIKSISWLRPDVHPHLKIDNPLNLPLRRVMPTGSIMGLNSEEVFDTGDYLAGQVSGWVQRPVIHTVQFRYGKGRVVMTTYALFESMRLGDVDPVGVVMFNDLIDYLGSERCQPKLSLDC